MKSAQPSLLIRSFSRAQLLILDRALAVAVGGLGWYAAADELQPPGSGWREPAWLSAVAGLLLAVPVAVRRVRPVMAALFALAVVVACVASGLIPHYAGVAPTIVLCLVLYTVGTDVGRRRSVVVVLLTLTAVVIVFLWVSREPFAVGLVAWVIGACWTVGRTIRERRAYAARSTEQATELAVGAERLRIARELHDIVAHSMSMIAVKATIADHVADAHPQEMREALRVIAVTSRSALGELRRALGVLRTDEALVPTPGLADLDELAGAARSTGLAVDLAVRGAGTVPEGVALAVYRVVQEALTNVVKHARATECRIDVDIGTDALRLEVADNGTAGTPSTSARRTRAGGAAVLGASAARGGAGGAEVLDASAGRGGVGAGVVDASAGRSGVGGADTSGSSAGRTHSGREALESSAGRNLAGGVESASDPRNHAGAAEAPGAAGRRPWGDEGQAAGGAGGRAAGQGLIGMRERAAMFGGELTAGPAQDGGWVVATTLRWGT